MGYNSLTEAIEACRTIWSASKAEAVAAQLAIIADKKNNPMAAYEALGVDVANMKAADGVAVTSGE